MKCEIDDLVSKVESFADMTIDDWANRLRSTKEWKIVQKVEQMRKLFMRFNLSKGKHKLAKCQWEFIFKVAPHAVVFEGKEDYIQINEEVI